MKSKIILVIFALCLPFSTLFAQGNGKKFTGSITYKITYPASATNPIVASLPTTITMQIAGNKAKADLVLPFGKNTFIMNGDDISILHLMESEAGKFFVKKTKEEINKSLPQATVTPLKETKMIAGQSCKAVEVNSANAAKKSKVFYSDELGNNNIYFNTEIRSVSGVMLEFEYNIMGIPVQLTAISVEPGRVSNKVFEIPAGFTETTEAKLREMKRLGKN